MLIFFNRNLICILCSSFFLCCENTRLKKTYTGSLSLSHILIVMLVRILIFLFIFSCFSCHHYKEQERIKFDAAKWKVQQENDFPYRDAMLDDLISKNFLKGINKETLINLLGLPYKNDNNYLFYRITRQSLGAFTLHTKTLVIKMDSSGLVQTVKIHQ